MYTVICRSTDGLYISYLSKEELEERLEEYYWGDVEIQNKFPNDPNTEYWKKSIIIIKGEIIVPKEVVVTKYEI